MKPSRSGGSRSLMSAVSQTGESRVADHHNRYDERDPAEKKRAWRLPSPSWTARCRRSEITCGATFEWCQPLRDLTAIRSVFMTVQETRDAHLQRGSIVQFARGRALEKSALNVSG